MSKAAIVILNWNGEKLLEQFLPSIIKYSAQVGVQIIIADNASTDNSLAYLKASHPYLSVIRLTENLGYAGGYNEALKYVNAEYYILLNSDVEVTSGWLKTIVNYLDKNPDIAVAQPKILAQKKKTHFEYAGASGGYIDKLGFPFCRGRIFDTVEQDFGQYNSIKDVFWASGACFAIRSKEFWEAGGFDTTFFAHMEEIDLCWRLKARGKRIVCIPQSIVYHIGGATLNEESEQKVYLNFRNNMLMIYKNVGAKQLKSVMRKRLFYNKIAAMKFYISGDKAKARAIYRAHRDYKQMRDEYTNARNENLNSMTNDCINEIYPRNIILDYYLRGKKVFSKFSFGAYTN